MHNLHGGKLYKYSKTYAPVIIIEEIVKIYTQPEPKQVEDKEEE